jgi:xylan 1,4-beta-xylosidase
MGRGQQTMRRSITQRRLACSTALFLLVSLFLASGVSSQRAFLAAAASAQLAPLARPPAIPVRIRVDASRPKGELRPIWRFFGADEPNFAYMKDGKKLLAELGQLRPREVYFRTHNLLSTGDGTPALKWGSTNAYTEDDHGSPVYDWAIVDRIFDTYLQRGVKPYVQIGFMPKALSVKPEPYQHHWTSTAKYSEIFTGWAYPPKDYAKWAELVFQWTRHCIERYGRAEVESWYWEVWNEANIGYWQGTPEEFRKLHDYAIDAVRRALPTARVGGPDTAGSGGQFMRDFIEHNLRGTNYANRKTGSPLDFISFHAKGSPKFVDGHVQMGIAEQLRAIDQGFSIISSYPEFKDKAVIVGESDPDGCAACQGPQLGYRNSTMYSSYTAASFAREHELAEKYGVNLAGALTWAFEFEGQPYFAGFRVLATNGIDQPVLNVFRMFGKMSGRRLPVESDGAVPLDTMLKDGVRARPDISALASMDKNKLCVLVWHYADDDVAGSPADIEVKLSGLPRAAGRARLTQYRIDSEHSNAFAEWHRMGDPSEPTSEQVVRLETVGRLATMGASQIVRVKGAAASVRLTLPRQAVSLLIFEW